MILGHADAETGYHWFAVPDHNNVSQWNHLINEYNIITLAELPLWRIPIKYWHKYITDYKILCYLVEAVFVDCSRLPRFLTNLEPLQPANIQQLKSTCTSWGFFL